MVLGFIIGPYIISEAIESEINLFNIVMVSYFGAGEWCANKCPCPRFPQTKKNTKYENQHKPTHTQFMPFHNCSCGSVYHLLSNKTNARTFAHHRQRNDSNYQSFLFLHFKQMVLAHCARVLAPGFNVLVPWPPLGQHDDERGLFNAGNLYPRHSFHGNCHPRHVCCRILFG